MSEIVNMMLDDTRVPLAQNHGGPSRKAAHNHAIRTEIQNELVRQRRAQTIVRPTEMLHRTMVFE